MKANFKNRVIVIEDIQDIKLYDAPDYVDAYICSAYYEDSGLELDDEELEELNDDRDLVYSAVIDTIY